MQRREFVRASATASTGVALAFTTPRIRSSRRLTRSSSSAATTAATTALDPTSTTTLRDPRVRALALRTIDAARSAGAVYADVRLTNTMSRQMSNAPHAPQETANLGLSVRALVNGYWGWAATPTLSTDEAVRVARLATQYATLSASRGKPRAVDLGTIPVVHDGDWMTPVKVDPFTLDVVDVYDWLVGIDRHLHDIAASRGAPASSAWIPRQDRKEGIMVLRFEKQERVFASTDGNLLTQTIIVTTPNFKLPYRNAVSLAIPDFNTPVQAGWERVSETPLVDLFIKEMDKADAAPPPPPPKPAEVGRYDMVFSARAMAQFLSGTFGDATQLDRTLGYEANATGTSYLGPDPIKRLGGAVAAPLVTITADRSTPFGLATVKWDDEGVAPVDFPLVQQGMLMNYQTTREQAPWLAQWSQKQGQPVRSLGCAMAPTAQEITMQHTPNLMLHPGEGTADVETLIQDLEHGVLIDGMSLQMDFQCLDGYCNALQATEIRAGKRVATLMGAGMLLRADTFWKDIQALGGASSTSYLGGFQSGKGEPAQYTEYSIGAVPARIKQLALINPLRKAS